jgi:acyl-CoA synthetase (AMP-forming)/AMP-acid ligase II
VALSLSVMAQCRPQQLAVVEQKPGLPGRYRYRSITFGELEEDSNRLAAGLQLVGVRAGTRLALMVRPGIDFVSLTFALLKAGAVAILIDPGLGRANLVRCLEDVAPDGFVAGPRVQLARWLYRTRFPQARLNVTVGRGRFLGCVTIRHLRGARASDYRPVPIQAHDPAAIIFTTGSTGPPKGVLYTHANFAGQIESIRAQYGIEPGGCDLACFSLFGLFHGAMGTTTVIPDMDAARPARVNPHNIVCAIHDQRVTQSFASPAVWDRVGRYCHERGLTLPTLRRVFSAGAPVPPRVLERIRAVIAPSGEVYTPYGATEALPVASISATEVLGETAMRTADGAGTCVGRRFAGMDWQIIRIVDGPVAMIGDADPLPVGQIGELIVRGPVVTSAYVNRLEQNALHKIADGDTLWHRMGDVGYLDDRDRFWFCGRKSERVCAAGVTMYTEACEEILNRHERVCRSALVGLGAAGRQTPVMVCEPWRWPRTESARAALRAELAASAAQHELTRCIRPEHVLLHPSLPVDVRHNAKILREELVEWVECQLGRGE